MLYTVPILTIPPPWQSHRESFCRFFISSSEGSVGVGVGGGERVLFIFLSQWGEAVYFTLQWCVSNHNKQVHLGSGIKSDKRTKMLKAGLQEEGPTVVLPCLCACRGHRCRTGGLPGTDWHGGSQGPLSSSAIHFFWGLGHTNLVPLCPNYSGCAIRGMKFALRFSNEKHCNEGSALFPLCQHWSLFGVNSLQHARAQAKIKRDPCSHTELPRGHFAST